ncbi:MAG: hypothetical protein JW734_05775 [Candidatus Omnitrophica bacterium]|nr:hypothetical protein [Candidatus Omnitrophota bacterium]
MLGNILSFLALAILSFGGCFLIYILIEKSLRHLLDEVIKLPSGTTFYLRVFSISLTLLILSTLLEVKFTFTEQTRFMEYVWRIASGVSTISGYICLFLLGYLLLVTILVAALRRRNEQ